MWLPDDAIRMVVTGMRHSHSILLRVVLVVRADPHDSKRCTISRDLAHEYDTIFDCLFRAALPYEGNSLSHCRPSRTTFGGLHHS